MLSKVKQNKVFDYPPCYSVDISVCFDLLAFDKSSTGENLYKAAFNELVERRYSDYAHYYTDGSKKDEIASYGGCADQLEDPKNGSGKRISLGVFSRRICDNSSIFTAEAEGIIHALKHIKTSPRFRGKFVIFSDSKSVLESIQSQNSKNVTLKEINEMIQFIHIISRKVI